MIEAGIIPHLVDILQNSEFKTRKEAAWAISNATSGGSLEQIKLVHDSANIYIKVVFLTSTILTLHVHYCTILTLHVHYCSLIHVQNSDTLFVFDTSQFTGVNNCVGPKITSLKNVHLTVMSVLKLTLS